MLITINISISYFFSLFFFSFPSLSLCPCPFLYPYFHPFLLYEINVENLNINLYRIYRVYLN